MRGRAAKGNVTSAVSHKGGAHGVRARGMSVSQVIAACGGSLNRGSHLSGDACHMMPRSLARRAGCESDTEPLRASVEGLTGLGLDPVRPVGSRAGRTGAVRPGCGPADPHPNGDLPTRTAGVRPSGGRRLSAVSGAWPPAGSVPAAEKSVPAAEVATRRRWRAPDTGRGVPGCRDGMPNRGGRTRGRPGGERGGGCVAWRARRRERTFRRERRGCRGTAPGPRARRLAPGLRTGAGT